MNALQVRVMEKTLTLVQSVTAAVPTYGVWDRIFHSEEVAANAERYKKSVDEQVEKLEKWQAELEDAYCKHISSSSLYRRAQTDMPNLTDLQHA